MRIVAPCTLTPLFCLLCLPALSQEVRVVRIGVALLSSAQNILPAEARDQLVNALNRHKVDIKQNISMHGVALDAPPGRRAITEGRDKSCDFVLYTRVEALEKASRNLQDIHGALQGQSQEVDTALVEYELRRVTDGAPYAIGIAKGQESDSVAEAILDAISYVPNKVAAELRDLTTTKLGGTAEIGGAARAAPGLNRDEYQGANFCAWLPKNIPHADALRSVCEYAATQPEKLPNFVCQQETSRYQGSRRVPTDLITATIRYVDGEESYRDIRRNGKPVPGAMWKTAGLWSSGLFEGNLRNIFDAGNHSAFALSGEKKIGARTAWVFTYHIARQYEPLWELRAEDQLAAPPYEGELWVDEKTGNLLHFQSTAKDLVAGFPIRNAEILSDYESVAFPDGAGFLLPVKSTVVTRYRQEALIRNVVELHGCHKFRATARMLLSDAPGIPDAENPAARASREIAADLEEEENEEIYAIMREDAIVEDAARFNLDQQQELKSATGEAFWKMAQLEKQREKALVTSAKEMRPDSKYELVSTSSGGANLKVYVRLVPVSIVVRDNKGHAVGGLKQEDFQLYDNRKLQEIVSFSLEKSPDAPGLKLAAGEEHDRPLATSNNVAYVFDDLHTASEDLARAKVAAERHLSQLAPGDHAAVFTTSGDVVLDFTADHEKLRSALQKLKSHSNASPADCPPMTYYAADSIVNQGDSNAMQLAMEEALECTFPNSGVGSQQQPTPAGRGGIAPEQGMELQKARGKVLAKAFEVASMGRMEDDRTLGLLHDVLGRAAAMAGRRSVLLLSPGFLALTREEQKGIMYLIQRALQMDVVFSTLDVRGLASLNLTSNRTHIGDPTETRVLDGQESSASSGVLTDLAYSTGGVYFHNNNDLDAGFRRTADAPEYVYVVGFSPQKLDGTLHKLKVTVSGPAKLTVQARQGYYALKPAASQ
jgi:VWFA-related protein